MEIKENQERPLQKAMAFCDDNIYAKQVDHSSLIVI